jgi:hypothetical protein
MESTRRSATFAVGSDSSSVYSDDEYKADIEFMGRQIHGDPHSKPNISDTLCENLRHCEQASPVSLAIDITTSVLHAEPESGRDASNTHTVAYRFEKLAEAEERRRRSTAKARPEQPNWRDTTLEKPRTHMQEVLAEYDAASAQEHYDGYWSEEKDTEEPIVRRVVPSRRHLRVVSADDMPSRHTRTTVMSTISLASTDSGELARGTGAYQHILQKDMHGPHDTLRSFTPVTSRPRAMSLPNTPSELLLDSYNSPVPVREIHQSAALLDLAGVDRELDRAFSRESSGQWLKKPARQSLLIARRRGRADWQKNGLISSTGQQYGLGDRKEGYVAGKYVTTIGNDVSPEVNRKRDAWKRVSCF